MADLTAGVPDDDPGEYPPEDYLHFIESPEPTLLVAPEDLRFMQSDEIHTFTAAIGDPGDPWDDQILRNMINGVYNDNPNAGFFCAGPSGTTTRDGAGPSNPPREYNPLPGESLNHFEPRMLKCWPVPPSPYQCSCCNVLREIVHVNGDHATKLELHGRLGFISHAVLDNRHSRGNCTFPLQGDRFQMFDFCKKSIENVKEFLQQYCEERRLAGYVMMQDPFTFFYEALCAGMELVDGNPHADGHPQQPTSSSEDAGQMRVQEPENRLKKTDKSAFAAQRERTAKMTIADVRAYFHLPIEEAGKRMNLSPTVIKNVCRKAGMERWPYRKVQSIEKQIEKLRELLNSDNPVKMARAQATIEMLQQEKNRIYDVS